MVYDHAVECANYPGMCDLDELMGLAGGKIWYYVIWWLDLDVRIDAWVRSVAVIAVDPIVLKLWKFCIQ
jgi:hypothetical protein